MDYPHTKKKKKNLFWINVSGYYMVYKKDNIAFGIINELAIQSKAEKNRLGLNHNLFTFSRS